MFHPIQPGTRTTLPIGGPPFMYGSKAPEADSGGPGGGSGGPGAGSDVGPQGPSAETPLAETPFSRPDPAQAHQDISPVGTLSHP